MSWVKNLLKAAAVATVFMGLQSTVRADSYEGFSYPSGTGLTGQSGGSGWSGAWDEPAGDPTNTQADAVEDPSLTYTGLATSGGHAVGKGQYNFVGRSPSGVNSSNGSSTFLSFLIRHDSQGDGAGFPADDPDYGGLELNGKVFVGQLASGQFGADDAGTGANAQSTGVAGALGQTAFIVAKIDWAAGADTISIFVNPTVGGVLGAAGAVKSDVDLGDLGSLGLSTGVNALWSVDELRIGGSFAAVAPGTSSAIPLPGALLAFPATAGLAGVAMRRFRRKA